MRLLLYYLPHTFVNCIKKLFRTWVVVLVGFFVVCGLVGGVVGFTVGSLEEDMAPTYDEEYDGDYSEEEIPLLPEEQATLFTVVEIGAGGLILLVLLLNIYSADKSGTKMFTMPDVQFLFTAPLKPQSVLLFRVVLQMGAMLVGSLYLAFQIPNLMMNLGLTIGVVLAVIACWILTLILGQLLTVLFYTLIATHPRLRPLVRYGVFGLAGAIGLAVYAVMELRRQSVWEAALWLFGSPYTRLIPGVGWLKALVGFALEGNWLAVAGCGAACVALCALLVFLTWRIKADFYEDALSAAAEKQEALNAAAEGRTAKRQKERADRTPRDVLRHGQGGWMFLHKGIANHHRFAFLRVLSVTDITYLGIFLVITLFIRLTGEGTLGHLLWIPAAIVAVVAFFRNLGNPVAGDMGGHLLYMVPDSPYRKLFSAVLAGSYSTLMDLLPGLVVATVVLLADPLEALAWLAFVLTMDFMVSCTGLLLHLGLPGSLPAGVLTLLQLMLKMLLVTVTAMVTLTLCMLWGVSTGLLAGAALHLALSCGFFFPAGAMLHDGVR